MPKIHRFLLGLVALAAAAAVPAADKEDGFQLMPMDQVEKLLGAPGAAIYDVNTPELWAKHHLPGAIKITGLTEKEIAPLLPPDRDTKLVFYCSNQK